MGPHEAAILAAQENFEGAPEPASFGWRLHERGVWDWELWWRLDRALLCLHEEHPWPEPLPRRLALSLYRLNHLCSVKLARHLDPAPGGRIANLDAEAARALLDRVDWVFDAAFNGRAYPNRADALANPLLPDEG